MPEARTGKNAAAKAKTGSKQAQSTQPVRGLSGATALSTGTVATPRTAATAAASSAIAALEEDHRHVEQLFADYRSAAQDHRKDELVQEICSALIIHTRLEEEIFYPACRAAADDEDPLDEAQVEHDSAKLLIADLLESSSDDPYRDAKVSVLSEQIKHHVDEEEKPGEGILAKAKANGVDTPDLAHELAARKQTLQGRAADLRPTRAVSLNAETQEGFMPRYGSYDRDRDERGRFISDDDERGGRRYASRGDGRRYYDDDDDGRGHGRGGWFGDSEGHSRAARSRFDDDRYYRSRSSRYDDDDDRGGRGRGRGGWFG
ncbi:hemerythrin domain-containing protein, partial [Reyranella sp.]|uniref:hemerythrin domain-containing protein n=1 Tax=Reyranella sp. TaxID=1929291 RepID=UPI003D144B6D